MESDRTLKPARSHVFRAGIAIKALTVAALAVLSFGVNSADAESVQPVAWEGSPLKIVAGTSSNYNFTTKDSDGTKYWLIQLDTSNMYAKNGIWSTEPISGYTSQFNIALPNSKTATLYYKYEQPSNYSPTSTRVTSLTSTNAMNKVFQNINMTSSTGGAVYNTANTNYSIISDFINNTKITSEAYKGGTAIFNSGKIDTISGYFYNNSAEPSASSYSAAAAIENRGGTINSINGVFINNHLNGKIGYNNSLDGAAISSLENSTINEINGVFIGNQVQGTSKDGAFGAAIRFYKASSGDITGVFINNSSTSPDEEATAAVMIGYSKVNGSITGDFINNHSQGAWVNGAAFQQYSNSSIQSSTMNIKGNFIGNIGKATSTTAKGAAIANSVSNASYRSIIENITANFIANGSDAANGAYGGVLANSLTGARISSINGYFIDNYAISTSGEAYGGGIYNTGIISNINNSSFYGNYAKVNNTSGNAKGGAIYTNQNLTFNSTDGYNSIFSGNYVQTGTNGTKYNEAIYMDNSSGVLTFNATTNGQYTFDDYINGVSGYDAHFTGDSSGKVNLYNDVKNGDVITDTITMNLANDETHNYTFRTLNSNANTKWLLDVSVDNSIPSADTITTTNSASTGTVTVSGLNFVNGSAEDFIDNDLKIQILKNTSGNNNLKLAIADSAKESKVISETITETLNNVGENTDWTGSATMERLKTTVSGELTLATTSTTNDSIGVKVTSVDTDMGSVIIDTLKAVNQSTTATRNFNATVDGELYTATDDLGKAGAGIININGLPSGAETKGTIDLNGHGGFELDKVTTLNLNQVNLVDSTNSSATLVTVSNANAKVNLTDASITGNIIAASAFDMTTSGKTTLNGSITNANLTNSGTLTNNALITGSVTNTAGSIENNAIIAGDVTVESGSFNNNAMISGDVSNSGILTSSAENLGGAITNTNRLNLSGILAKEISGNGTTYVNETLTLNDGSSVSNLNVNGGTLTVNSGAAISSTLNANNGTIKLTPSSVTNLAVNTLTGSGNLELDIDYTGSSVVADSLTSTNDGSGTLTITALNEIGTRKDFSVQVLNGGGDDLLLAIDNNVVEDFTNVDIDTEYEYDPVTSPAKWTDVFKTTKTVTTTTRNIFIENNKTLTYGITDTDVDVTVTKTGDTLALVNQATLTEREFNATEENQIYITESNLGKAEAGTVTINGNPNPAIYGDDPVPQGTIDLVSTYSGFELDKATTLNLNDVIIQNAKAGTDIVKSTFADSVTNLSNTILDGTVSNTGKFNVNNSKITGTITNTGTLNLNEGAQLGSAVTGAGTTNINNDFTLNSVITGNDVVLNGAELTMGSMGMLSGANSFTVEDGSTLNLQNGIATNTDLGNFTLNGDMALKIDGNFASKQIDTITATSFSNPNDSSISITNVNVLTPITDESFSISPIGTMEDAGVKAALASAIEYNAGDIAMTPIYKYSVAYDKDNAMLQFTRSGGGGSGDFNPAVVAAPVATQAAAQVTMENTFNYSFSNSDTFMLIPKQERIAIRNRNKYAIAENELPDGSNPLYQIQDTSSAWFKPYASFENVPLKNGPKVNVISYGALAGYDTDLKELKRGWARAWTGFVGYNGASINYSDVSTIQNGGILGGTLTMYKGNFFNATTLSVGATVGENNTRYGHETTTSLLSGIGNKTGYNFEFKEGKFIIQPNLFLGYTMVKTFDYTNAAGVRIDSNPSHTFQISPGLKLIGNLKHGWQPYIGVNMVWNVLNNSRVKANSVTLPQMSVKPYIQYGIGLQKTVKDNFVAYGQAMVQNGGRNGISLTAGFRWAIGKINKPTEKVQKQSNEQKVSDRKIIKQKVHNKTTETKKVGKISEFFAKMDGELLSNSTITP